MPKASIAAEKLMSILLFRTKKQVVKIINKLAQNKALFIEMRKFVHLLFRYICTLVFIHENPTQ